MSPVCSCCLMARLTFFVLCLDVAGLWCHPVPDNGINNNGTVSPLGPSVEKLGQANEMFLSETDDDYPEMMTEFLRLTTTVPTVVTSTKSPFTTSQSTATPLTTLAPLTPLTPLTPLAPLAPLTPLTPLAPLAEKAFETAKFGTTTERPVTEIGKSTTQETTTEPVAKETLLNPVQPQMTVVPVQSEQTADTTVVAQHTTDIAPTVDALKSQPQKVVFGEPNSSPNVVQSFTTDLPVTFKQTARQPLGSNPVQQQQMAVSTAPVQQANLVQTAASNGPTQQQQQQQPSFSPQGIITQQEMMQNPPMGQYQTRPNPSVVQQPMITNPFMVQQQLQNRPLQSPPMMFNPFLRPQRPYFQVPITLVNSKIINPLTNQLVRASQQRYYIRGSAGTPLKIIPLSAFRPFVSPLSSNGIQMPFVGPSPVQ